ncbi:MAG: hypothetical protein OXG37_09490 [Actinomycetia bacterium]|nr:hypothetical protein [Actinomycetes bacterium]
MAAARPGIGVGRYGVALGRLGQERDALLAEQHYCVALGRLV